MRPARLLLAALRALVALVAAAVLLVGVPLALLRFVGDPRPTALPSWDEFSFAVTRGQIDTWTWVKLFALIAWAAWANLVAGFVVELAAAVGGARPGRWRGLGATRWLAARLIAQWVLAASLLLPAATPVVASLPSLAAPVLALTGPDTVARRGLSARLDVASGPGTEAGEPSPMPTVEVGRRDTLWGLAERHLGSGARWEAVRDANVGRAMPDGTVLRPGFTRVEVGWRLVLPAPAVSARSEGGYLPPSQVVVERGDNLWRLAEERLGAAVAAAPATAEVTDQEVAGYVVEVVEGNRSRIDDPDLIFPGQRFDLPAVGLATVAPPLPPAPDPGPSAPPPVNGPTVPVAPVTASTSVAPPVAPVTASTSVAPPVAPVTASTSVARPVAPVTAATSVASAPPVELGAGGERPGPSEADDEGTQVDTTVLGVGGGLLAAGVMELVRRRRRYRLAHRRPNTVPVAPAPSLDPIERLLSRQADPALAGWLQAALGSLAARPVWEGEAVAQPVLVQLGPDQLEILFSHPDPMAAPLPWTTADGGSRWHLARGIPAGDLPAPDGPSALPTLVTVGADTLLNLEAAGLLGVTGVGDGPHDLLRSLVHELATSPSAGPVDIRSTLPVDGAAGYHLFRRDTPADLARELGPWLDAAAECLTASRASNAYAHRLAGGEPLTPVVVITDWVGRSELVKLARHAATRVLPFSLLVLDPVADDEYRIELDGASARLRPWDVTVRAQLLSRDGARQLAALLADAASDAAEPVLPGLRLSASVTELRQRPPSAPPHPDPVPPRPDAVPAPADPIAGTSIAVDPATMDHPAGDPPAGDPSAGEPPAGEPLAVEPLAVEPPAVDPGQPGPAGGDVGPLDEIDAAPVADHRDGSEPLGDEPVEADRFPDPITVRVLGPVDVVGLTSELTSQQLSLLCYLACNGPSNRATLVDALWDGQVISPGRFPNLLAELRARIGRHHFPEARDGRYELVAVTTDLDAFERGLATAGRQDRDGAIATLHSMMEAVRGLPLTVPSPRFWSWVGDQTHFSARVEAMVADTAARLARLEQERGHLDGARWACEQGLLASPTDETLVTTLTEVYVAAGRTGLARRLVDGWEERISRMECGEPSDEPRKRLAG